MSKSAAAVAWLRHVEVEVVDSDEEEEEAERGMAAADTPRPVAPPALPLALKEEELKNVVKAVSAKGRRRKGPPPRCLRFWRGM
eukprot:evm.model.NODE_3836_length_13751_cov_70.976944.2